MARGAEGGPPPTGTSTRAPGSASGRGRAARAGRAASAGDDLVAAADQGRHPRRWRVLTFLAIAQFMLIVDVTVVAIALPLMGADLDMSRAQITWVVSAYTLTFGGLMLLGGRLADLVGPRRVVAAGLIVFTLASFTAGLADQGAVLLASRVGQGLGAAMLSPAALSVVVRLFAGDERNRALGFWSAMGGAGGAVGVLLGGLITAGPGWPWVFFINVPVGAVIVLVILRLLPPLPAAASGGRLDVLGAALVTTGTGALIYAVIDLGEQGWTTTTTLLLAAAAVLYLAFVWRQKTASSPLMDLALLGRRAVTAGAFVIAVATALMVGVFFLGSFYLQQVADLGPLVTGLLFLPVALATMVGANAAGRLIARLGARRLALGGTLLAAAGLAAAAVWPTVAGVVTGISVGAAGIGALFVVASATALGQVQPHEAGLASGIVSTFHEFGASIGAATVSSAAAAALTVGAADGFQRAFATAAAIAMVAAVVSVLLIPRPPQWSTS